MSPTSYGFSAGPASNWSQGGSKPGIASLGQATRIGAISDGTSNTIAMSELRIGLNKGKWQTGPGVPRDPSYGVTGIPRVQWANNTAGRTWSNSPGHVALLQDAYNGCLAMYDAGSGWSGSYDEQGRFWAAGRTFWGPYHTTLIKPNAGPACDYDTSVTNIDIKEPSSYHTGGVQAVLCDGSVRFISESLDQATWIAAGSINGSEAIGDW